MQKIVKHAAVRFKPGGRSGFRLNFQTVRSVYLKYTSGMAVALTRLVQEIDDICRSLADPARAQKYARFFREGYDAYGVDHKDPRWTAKQQEWASRFADQPIEKILRFGQSLFATGKYEHGAVAIQFASGRREEIGPEQLAGLRGWLELVKNWAHCDVICGELIAPAIASGCIEPEQLDSWASADGRFVRRGLPVSLLGAIPGGSSKVLLQLVEPLMMDGERVVQQGMGWFLRELWKTDPAPVEALLLAYRDEAPRLIFQYATERMTPASRGKFRRVKAPRK